MPQIETIADPSLFRTTVTSESPSRVDRKANVIYGANLMQIGDLPHRDVRKWTVDMGTLLQAQEMMSRGNNGSKSRFTHPHQMADGMGSYLGRWKNIRIEGDTLRGDLHIADAAFKSPKGDLGTYVMDLAESDPDVFGVSLAADLDRSSLKAFDRTNRDGKRWPIRFTAVRAGDIVDEPASAATGLFQTNPAETDEDFDSAVRSLISAHFSDAEPGVVRGRIESFLDQYFSTGKEDPMADAPETTVAETPVTTTTAAAEVLPAPVAETSAAGATSATETTSTDLAVMERDRCKKIRALCELAGATDKFNLFVDSNFSVAETNDALREIVAKKNPALSSVVQETVVDNDADLKAEFAEMVKFKVTMGQSEADYIAHARRKSA